MGNLPPPEKVRARRKLRRNAPADRIRSLRLNADWSPFQKTPLQTPLLSECGDSRQRKPDFGPGGHLARRFVPKRRENTSRSARILLPAGRQGFIIIALRWSNASRARTTKSSKSASSGSPAPSPTAAKRPPSANFRRQDESRRNRTPHFRARAIGRSRAVLPYPSGGLMPLQCRLTDKSFNPADAHGCPACPHPVIGPAIGGSPNVLVNNLPALRVTDPGIHAACCGPNTWIAAKGSGTVLINSLPAHRLGDTDTHCGGIGTMVSSSTNVTVGG